MARESIAFGIYFKTFEECKENDIHPFFGGAAAGLANWTATYPIDSIRSRQLAYKCTIMDAIKKGNLWNGYIPCVVRAVTVNSVGFYVYDKLKKYLIIKQTLMINYLMPTVIIILFTF